MDHDAEVTVEQEEISPGEGKLKSYKFNKKPNVETFINLLLLVPLPMFQEIHVDGEGDVLHHDQAVCHSYPSEDHVDGVLLHVLVGQNQNVCNVEEGPKNAHNHGKLSVD